MVGEAGAATSSVAGEGGEAGESDIGAGIRAGATSGIREIASDLSAGAGAHVPRRLLLLLHPVRGALRQPGHPPPHRAAPALSRPALAALPHHRAVACGTWDRRVPPVQLPRRPRPPRLLDRCHRLRDSSCHLRVLCAVPVLDNGWRRVHVLPVGRPPPRDRLPLRHVRSSLDSSSPQLPGAARSPLDASLPPLQADAHERRRQDRFQGPRLAAADRPLLPLRLSAHPDPHGLVPAAAPSSPSPARRRPRLCDRDPCRLPPHLPASGRPAWSCGGSGAASGSHHGLGQLRLLQPPHAPPPRQPPRRHFLGLLPPRVGEGRV
mmetsp:Transcript_21816/g.72133  ORF Transcript_21816/g.72133 Transcript_21816/m.72133 type:complete len:321 (-) Transcript_21816:3323-4285(-)